MTTPTLTPASAPASPATERGPTLGVEEEFVLLDPQTGLVSTIAADVIRACADRRCVSAESMSYMVETRTPVCRTLAEVRHSLNLERAHVAAEARRRGAAVVASGVAPYGVPDPPPVTPDPRYDALVETFPTAMRTTGTCACHVHVAVPNRQAGVDVLRRIRRWLPALAALASNSPVWEGRDVGWASTRYVFATRWPTAVPALPVRSAVEYDRAVAAAVTVGDALDVRSVYYLARLSPRHPTVEVRIGDAFLTVAEAAAYAGVVRAMVGKALADAARGRPAQDIPQRALIAACRTAARVGLAGNGVDVATGRAVPAWDLVDSLVADVLPYLDRYGDAPDVLATLYRMRLVGGGAERQRRMWAQTPTPVQFVSALADATISRFE